MAKSILNIFKYIIDKFTEKIHGELGINGSLLISDDSQQRFRRLVGFRGNEFCCIGSLLSRLQKESSDLSGNL